MQQKKGEGRERDKVFYLMTLSVPKFIQLHLKKKQSRNMPGVAQRVPGGLGSQISLHSVHEGGEVVSLTTPAAFTPGNVPGTHFH